MRIRIGNIGLDQLTRTEATQRVCEDAARGIGGFVVTPNLDFSWIARHMPDASELFALADISVVDGMPLVWLARLAGTPLPERIAGVDLFLDIADTLGANVPLLLVGGQPNAARLAGEKLRARNPQLRTAEYCPPFGFEKSEEGMRQLREFIAHALQGTHIEARVETPHTATRGETYKSAVVMLALGAPKQERVAQMLRTEFPQCWFIGIGASIDITAGLVARAPMWMQNAGCEWLYRLYREPTRLFTRYVLHDIPHVVWLFVQVLRQRLRAGGISGNTPAS